MTDMGNEQAGFSTAFDALTKVVSVRAWGFWSVEVARAFGQVVGDECRSRPRGTTLLVDMAELKPMRDEGQFSFAQLMTALPKLGIARTTIITSSHLTKLQLLRIATECGASNLVEFAQPDDGFRKHFY
jgi:hypothetical protein